MEPGNTQNQRTGYFEPLSRRESDSQSLAFLLACILDGPEGEGLKKILRQAFGTNRFKFPSAYDATEEMLDAASRIGASPEVLRRMWGAYLAEWDRTEGPKPIQRSAWMDCPIEIRHERKAIIAAAESLTEQLRQHLFDSPWDSEIDSTQRCIDAVGGLSQKIESLANQLRIARTNQGDPIAPLVHGRPRPGLSDTMRRNLKAYAVRSSGVETKDERILSLFLEEDQRLTNPQHRKAASNRAHKELSKVRKWIGNISHESNGAIEKANTQAPLIDTPSKSRFLCLAPGYRQVRNLEPVFEGSFDESPSPSASTAPECFDLRSAMDITLRIAPGESTAYENHYIVDPLVSMLSMPTLEEKMTAVFYRASLGTNININALREENVPECVVRALDALVKRNGESREEHMLRLKLDALAQRVLTIILDQNIKEARKTKGLDRLQTLSWKATLNEIRTF